MNTSARQDRADQAGSRRQPLGTRKSGHPEDFARVGAARFLTGLEITHINRLAVGIKRALHKSRFAIDAGGIRNFGGSRRRLLRCRRIRRCAPRRRHGDWSWSPRIVRRWRRSHIVSRDRCIRIWRLDSSRVRIRQPVLVQILVLRLGHTIPRGDVQGTSAPTARNRRAGVRAGGETGGRRGQKKCPKESFHGGYGWKGGDQAFTRMGISTYRKLVPLRSTPGLISSIRCRCTSSALRLRSGAIANSGLKAMVMDAPL